MTVADTLFFFWTAAQNTSLVAEDPDSSSVDHFGSVLEKDFLLLSNYDVDDDDVAETFVVASNNDMNSNDLCSCLAKWSWSDCSPSTIFLAVFCLYLLVATISNLVGMYKFIVAWNLIMDQQRLDLPEFYKRRRRMTYKDVLKLQLAPKSINAGGCCIICLSDFTEHDIVTSCSDGCRNWFHKDCLFEWLDRSENCPCCRRDMLHGKTRGFFADLSAACGFTPRTSSSAR